jgi:TPR repeat protein
LGVSQDYKLAMEWYQKAASNGSTDAQNSIGCLYSNGLGVPQDYKIAMEWYQKAADNNNKEAKVALERLNKQGINTKEHKGSIYLCLFHNSS